MLIAQGNRAITYQLLGRVEDALRLKRDVYSGRLKLFGIENEETLRAANNYATSLVALERYQETKTLLQRTMSVARRVLGENDKLTLKMRSIYAQSLYEDNGATLDDIREAVTTFEETERTARRVFGGAHPLTVDIEGDLRDARVVLRARETPPPPGQA